MHTKKKRDQSNRATCSEEALCREKGSKCLKIRGIWFVFDFVGKHHCCNSDTCSYRKSVESTAVGGVGEL